ncbi:flagellar motor switch protein FliG [Glaciecola siphonariae]|uniref:Flagellar motor switch protein FliG n=1 Tax=Glaciecola siphonariae TaxID=521012 RepID=A0ABV9LTT3_9ALTE
MAENTELQTTEAAPAYDVSKLDGIEKAAILLLSLSEDDAAEILKFMQPKQVQALGSAMAAMDDMTQAKINSVHKHFIEEIQNYSTIGFKSEDFVRRTLTTALGEDKAAHLLDQILAGAGAKGLESLKWMDSKQVANIIRNEHPQIQTIVMSYLEPEQSAEIMAQFPEKVRLDLLMRVANLEEVQPAALQELNEIMEKQFAGQAGAQAAKMGGLKSAANIMNYLDTNIEAQLMDAIREQDEEMSQQIQDLMFVFDNLIDVDDRGIQAILREVQQESLMKAIKGADEELRNKITGNMSKRAAEMLIDDMEAMGPVRLSEVETAQKEILSIARRLADAGEIVLSGGGGEEFV